MEAAPGVDLSERNASMTSTIQSAAAIELAEAVRLDRRRTRVLDIVESIESRSHTNSPSTSPER